ncbi:PEP-CTERM putative exosortase interaction domain-containing protein [Opitutaceae bacterium TAV1]|nr:PEP-CTERM putative exosortase interaction domain-containing protein [Opitutaceae bacterium TAV1]
MITLIHKTAILTTLGIVAILPARADLVDTWVTTGTWSALNASVGSGSGATITATGYSVGYPSELDGLLYTFFATPTFTISTSTVLDDVSTISVAIFSSAAPLDVSLNFNSDNTDLINYTLTTEAGGHILGEGTSFATSGTNYIYTWDVSGLGGGDDISISWGFGQHAAFDTIVLTQSAVPEPSTYAAIVGTAMLAGVLILRRRKV